MKFHLTQTIFILLCTIASAIAHPYPILAARERIPYTTNPNPNPPLPVPKVPTSTVASPGASAPPPAPCGQTLTFHLFTRTNSTPPLLNILLVVGQLSGNGKQICTISNFVDPQKDQENRMVCELGYSASFNFKTLTGKLRKEGLAKGLPTVDEGIFAWDRERGGGWKEGEYVTWKWETEAC